MTISSAEDRTVRYGRRLDSTSEDDRTPDASSGEEGGARTAAPRRIQRQREAFARPLMHDLRATQASILSVVQVRQFDPDAMSESVAFGQIEQLARRALELAEEFSRVNRALSDELVFEDVDLTDALTVAVDLAWERASRQGVRVGLAPSSSQASCIAHRELLIQALSALIDATLRRCAQPARVECSIGSAERDAPGLVLQRAWVVVVAAVGTMQPDPEPERQALASVPLAVAVARRLGGGVDTQMSSSGSTAFRMWLPGGDES